MLLLDADENAVVRDTEKRAMQIVSFMLLPGIILSHRRDRIQLKSLRRQTSKL